MRAWLRFAGGQTRDHDHHHHVGNRHGNAVRLLCHRARGPLDPQALEPAIGGSAARRAPPAGRSHVPLPLSA